MNDLLMDSFVGDANGNTSRESDIETGPQLPRSSSEVALESFNKQVQEVDKQVDKLSVLLQQLKEANEESRSVTEASSMKAIRKRMEKDVDKVGKIARSIKGKIEAINKDNLANRPKPGCGQGTAVDRLRTNMTNALTKKFKELMAEFQTLRQRIEDEYREIVERRVIAVTGNRPDEEAINRLIETGSSEQIFQQAMQEPGHRHVMSTFEEIQERHDAVKEIEEKLIDLQQIFLDMACLVDPLGHILDEIESQVSKPFDGVLSGATLRRVRKLRNNSIKWMCFAIILLLLIVAIVVLGVVKPWKN